MLGGHLQVVQHAERFEPPHSPGDVGVGIQIPQGAESEPRLRACQILELTASGLVENV